MPLYQQYFFSKSKAIKKGSEIESKVDLAMNSVCTTLLCKTTLSCKTTLHQTLFTVYAEMLQKMENCLKKIPKHHSICLKSFLSFGNFLVIFENHENRKKNSKSGSDQ